MVNKTLEINGTTGTATLSPKRRVSNPKIFTKGIKWLLVENRAEVEGAQFRLRGGEQIKVRRIVLAIIKEASGFKTRTEDPEFAMEMIYDSERLMKVINRVGSRTSAIFKFHYGLEGEEFHTLEETGKRFSLSKERIRVIVDNAMIKLIRMSIRDGAF